MRPGMALALGAMAMAGCSGQFAAPHPPEIALLPAAAIPDTMSRTDVMLLRISIADQQRSQP